MANTDKARKGQLDLANLRKLGRLAGPKNFEQNPSDTRKARFDEATLGNNQQLVAAFLGRMNSNRKQHIRFYLGTYFSLQGPTKPSLTNCGL